jgi:hypothetical protein
MRLLQVEKKQASTQRVLRGMVRRIDTSLLMGDPLTRATLGYKSGDVP